MDLKALPDGDRERFQASDYIAQRIAMVMRAMAGLNKSQAIHHEMFPDKGLVEDFKPAIFMGML